MKANVSLLLAAGLTLATLPAAARQRTLMTFAPDDAPTSAPAVPAPPPSPIPSPDGPAPVSPSAPGPAPSPASPVAPAPARLVGVMVVARGQDSRRAASALARRLYQEPSLRPRLTERDAQILVGHPVRADESQDIRDTADAVSALPSLKSEGAQRQLLMPHATRLGVRYVALVGGAATGAPNARVIDVSKSRFLSITLAPKLDRSTEEPSWDWSDAVAVLKGIAATGAHVPGKQAAPGPLPGPRAVPEPVAGGLDKKDDDDDDWAFLESPWFWGSVGAVVAVGATVLILTQTSVNEPDVVAIGGNVSP